MAFVDYEAKVAKEEQVQGWFEKHRDKEYLQFDQIENPKHPRADLCGLLYLHDLNHDPETSTHDAIADAQHDILFPNFGYTDLTEEDVIYLLRCGVLYGDEYDCLYMHA